jgi:hypothetical protein
VIPVAQRAKTQEPSNADLFAEFYAERETQRIARGDVSPEAVGRMEAHEQVAREREQLEAMERAYGE